MTLLYGYSVHTHLTENLPLVLLARLFLKLAVITPSVFLSVFFRLDFIPPCLNVKCCDFASLFFSPTLNRENLV